MTLTRRDLLKLGASIAVGTPSVTVQAQTRRPNIVFIVADDLGYADVSCYGRRDLKTPNVDRLATEGVRFTQAYANSPVCTASRVALLTGRYQVRLAVGLEEPISATAKTNVGLPPSHPTLASLLRSGGYSTTLIGKWHLGGLPDYGPLKSGYDHFYGFRGGAIDYYRHTSGGAAETPDLWDDDLRISQVGYSTDLFGNRATQVIDNYARAGRPFLLSLHFNAPHWPWEAPGDQAESQRLVGRPLFHRDGGSQEVYRRMVLAMDTQIGRVVGALQRNRLWQDTIVVFTSDNGGERFSDTWPFTGMKTELLEGGIRIPAVVSWPARIKAGRVSEQVTANMDWLPTLIAAAGAELDPAYPPDGMNLLPHLVEGSGIVERKLFWRFKALWQRAARIGDWKYLKILDNTFLFNVVSDPMERANLKDRHPDVLARLVSEWNAWNSTMLPETRDSFTAGFTGADLADHLGMKPVSLDPDPELR